MMFPIAVCLVLAADASPPAAAPADLRAQVEQALRRNALDGFAGTVTFVKELWFPPRPSAEDGHSLQEWEITTDGQGQIRMKVVCLNGSRLELPILAGETHNRIWATIGDELHVCDRQAIEQMADFSPPVLQTAQLLGKQAVQELKWVLGPLAEPRTQVDILMLDGDSQGPRAVVKIAGELRTVIFQTVENTLLPATSVRDHGRSTYQWTFSGFHRVNDLWVPESVELVQTHRTNGQSQRFLRTEISVTPIADPSELRDAFAPARQGDPDFGHVRIVHGYSENGKSVKVNGLAAVLPPTEK